jgi:hypothetical protein
MNFNLNYTLPDKTKRLTFIVMGLGILLLVLGIVWNLMGADAHHEGEHHGHAADMSTRLWANFLVNAFFFMGIGLGATFYIALKYATESHYAVSFKRVAEAVSKFLPYGAVLMAVVLLAGQFHLHHLYHWMSPEVYDINSPEYDAKIVDKEAYLNPVFFWGRFIVFFGVWILCQRKMLKNSLEEDMMGGTQKHFKNVTLSAIFLVFFGFTSSVAAWDWTMSLDVHWFSTMWGWYTFSGIWISSLVTILLLVFYLKGRGYLEFVNDSHIHDLGKWIFAISFLWTYLFFCQFMLIWYANIPEEVTYYMNRLETNGYMGIFWTMFFVNFALPMLLLMSRDAKRTRGLLVAVSLIIFFFHWLDVFVIVMPSTVASHWHLGGIEFGMFLFFLGFLTNRLLNFLTEAPLLPKNSPYVEESLHHHT